MNSPSPVQPDLSHVSDLFKISDTPLFWTPKYLFSSCSLEHLPFVFWLVDVLRPRESVSMGINKAVAHFAICQAVKQLDLDTNCQGFGSWGGNSGSRKIPDGLQKHNTEHYKSFSQLQWGMSDDAALCFTNGSIDFLNVGQRLNISLLDKLEDKWLPLMSERGAIMLCHIEKAAEMPEVVARLDALRQRFAHIEFHHGGGTLILLTGPDPAPALLEMAEASQEPAYMQSIQQMFGKLGKACRMEILSQHDLSQAQSLGEKREQQDDKNEGIHQELLDLRKAYDLRHKATSILQAELFDMKQQAQKAVPNKAQALSLSLDARDAQFSALHDQLDAVTRERNDLARVIEEKFK